MATSPANAAQALPGLEASILREPANAALRIEHARCLLHLRRAQDALASAATARLLAERQPKALEALASFYIIAREERLALEAFDRLLTLEPRHPGALFNRATVRRFTGDLAGAEADYDALIELQPQDYEAYGNRSDLRRQSAGRNHIAELEALLAKPLPDWRSEVQLRYALAKELEDVAEYALSWQHLTAGAALRRRHLKYEVAKDLQTVEWIKDAFAEPLAPPTERVDAPIFIVGLPRSGSTLIERILSSHPAVASGGELNYFTDALLTAVNRANGGRTLDRQALIGASAQVDFALLGRDYTERARWLMRGKPRITDKLPLNYLYCGLIQRALPGARIVHVTRHPMAVCHAMFKTLFRQGYPFSYDLAEIGAYYRGYRGLMQHWETVMPQGLHQVSYERLIADQRGETRRLLAFCGLEWDERCLAFEKNPAPTATASASQVRMPLYDTAIALWRHYAQQLGALRHELELAAIEAS